VFSKNVENVFEKMKRKKCFNVKSKIFQKLQIRKLEPLFIMT